MPYKGSTLAHSALISGRTTLVFDTATAVKTQVNQILQMADVRKTLVDAAIEPGAGSAQQFIDLIAAETVKWGEVAKDAGIQPE